MNLQASNLALIFGPEAEAGKAVRLLWPFDISERGGHRWIARIRGERDCVILHRSLMSLDCDPRSDPDALKLFEDAGQAGWDK